MTLPWIALAECRVRVMAESSWNGRVRVMAESSWNGRVRVVWPNPNDLSLDQSGRVRLIWPSELGRLLEYLGRVTFAEWDLAE